MSGAAFRLAGGCVCESWSTVSESWSRWRNLELGLALQHVWVVRSTLDDGNMVTVGNVGRAYHPLCGVLADKSRVGVGRLNAIDDQRGLRLGFPLPVFPTFLRDSCNSTPSTAAQSIALRKSGATGASAALPFGKSGANDAAEAASAPCFPNVSQRFL